MNKKKNNKYKSSKFKGKKVQTTHKSKPRPKQKPKLSVIKVVKKPKTRKKKVRRPEENEDNKHIIIQTLFPVYLCWKGSLGLIPSSTHKRKIIIEEMLSQYKKTVCEQCKKILKELYKKDFNKPFPFEH